MKDYEFDKLKLADWNPQMAAPLVSSTLTMDDLLENSEGYIFENPSNGLIYLVYDSKVSTGVIDDYLIVPDQFLNTEETFMMPPLLPGDSFVLVFSHPYEMNLPGGERLDSLRMDGLFNLQVQSGITHSGRIEVELPFLLRNGKPVTLTLDHNYTGSLPVLINQQIDLSECVLVTATQGSTSNVLEPKYKIVLYGDNNTGIGPFTINMGESLTDIDFTSAFGQLGNREEELSDTLLIDAFSQVDFGNVAIDSVILRLLVRNSFGLPVLIVPQAIWGYSPASFPYKFYVDDLATQYNIAAPVLAGIGQFAETRHTIRSASLASVLNQSPRKLYYHFVGQINPPPSTGYNFILDTSRVDLDVQVEIPLSGRVGGLVLHDTVDFSMEDVEELQSAGFRVHIENNFPLEAEFQAYMLDESGLVVDSLFSGYSLVIASGTLGPTPELRILSPGTRTTDVLFSGTRRDHLLQTSKLVLKGRLKTTGGNRVKVYGDAWLKVRIGANAALNISIDD